MLRNTIRLLSAIAALVLTSAESIADDKQPTRQPVKRLILPGESFLVGDRPAFILWPAEEKRSKPQPWIMYAPTLPGLPDSHEKWMHEQFVAAGIAVAGIDVGEANGSPAGQEHFTALYRHLTEKLGFATKPCLLGRSRGGLWVSSWAIANPDKVAGIAGIYPVFDLRSYPGVGRAAPAYSLTPEQLQAKLGEHNPIARIDVLATARVPVCIIHGDVDKVVPLKENSATLVARYEQADADDVVQLIIAEGQGHNFWPGFFHCQELVEFATAWAKAGAAAATTDDAKPGDAKPGPASASQFDLLRHSKRVVFLGDSITYAGSYVAYFDAWLLSQNFDQPPTVIDVGLPSETVSGLSEEGHAGGRFPRPDLAERLTRVLAETKPDLVFACYGINCGIYQPFDEERFARYRQGVANLRKQVEAAGATLVLVTPPSYDDQRAKKSFSYNAVLDRYAEWLLARRDDGWLVVDLHEPMTRELARQRETAPEFTFQPDAVHPNEAGHWFMARQLIRWFGDEQAAGAESPEKMLATRKIPAAALKLVQQRKNVRRDAYLTAAGHKRPGIRAGLPIEEAEAQAARLSAQIRQLQSQ